MIKQIAILAAVLSIGIMRGQTVPQSFTVVNQTITGSGSIITAPVNLNGQFSSAQYSWSVSQPQNGSTSASCVIQGTNDGVTWRDMFGMGTQNGTSASGSGNIGAVPALPLIARAKCTWSGGFVLSISLMMFP